MSQRSYANDRYRKDAKVGKTRKSAAKAKPVRKQGEVAASSAKPKQKSGVEKDWSGLPTSPEIKKWRRVWWGLLLAGLALLGIGWFVPELRASPSAQAMITAVVFAMAGGALYIDLRVIRKLRNQLIAKTSGKKKDKAAR